MGLPTGITVIVQRRHAPCSTHAQCGCWRFLDDDLRSYWTESGPYDEIYYYVKHNVGAVRDDLVRMVGGESVRANVSAYSATSRELSTKDEIFSAMVVYGFLTYRDGAVSIPNHELMLRFQNVLAKEEMGYVARLAQRSHDMLTATLAADTQTMEEIIQGAHDQEVPLLRYANESDRREIRSPPHATVTGSDARSPPAEALPMSPSFQRTQAMLRPSPSSSSSNAAGQPPRPSPKFASVATESCLPTVFWEKRRAGAPWPLQSPGSLPPKSMPQR